MPASLWSWRSVRHNVPVEPRAFVPALQHMRTDAERRDQELSWARPDEAFFASGACHVLAFRFLHRYGNDRHRVILIRPIDGLPGSHAYVTDGAWAFDFNGWTPEEYLLAESTVACRRLWPSWDFERIEVEDDLEAFCVRWQHRPPSDFASDVTARADRYIDRFPRHPPMGRADR